MFKTQRSKALHQKRLIEMLSRASDVDFLQMMWVINSGEDPIKTALSSPWFIRKPPDAVNFLKEIKYFFMQWETETLTNLLLSTKKKFHAGRAGQRHLDCQNLHTVVSAYNYLRSLENDHDGLALRNKNVLSHMHRLGGRQFPWQRGVVNRQSFFKSSYIYGSELGRRKFENRYGFSMDEFCLVGFALYTQFKRFSGLKRDIDLSQLGIESDVSGKAVALLTSPINLLRLEAKKIGKGYAHPAYRPSVLRKKPIIEVGTKLYCPLPDLIINRITEWIYYDICATDSGSFDGYVNQSIGKNFENYSKEIIRAFLPEAFVLDEFQYNSFHSPDILVGKGKKIDIIIECKATKQPLPVKIGTDEDAATSRGLDEMARGVFQIWRFFSHISSNERNNLPDVSQDAFGVLLTLDTWLESSLGQCAEVMNRANDLADKDGTIAAGDRRPVVFCHMDDLEYLLMNANEDEFFQTLRYASKPERLGWSLIGLLAELGHAPTDVKNDPLHDRIESVVTWMGRLDKLKTVRPIAQPPVTIKIQP
ncbi:hypothetical protein F9K77_13970 [Ochrobactrum sp. LMG 5442]|nr:hypothetical protein F9K77_13970 [Ochrobactrum sp. LMG 5442]